MMLHVHTSRGGADDVLDGAKKRLHRIFLNLDDACNVDLCMVRF